MPPHRGPPRLTAHGIVITPQHTSTDSTYNLSGCRGPGFLLHGNTSQQAGPLLHQEPSHECEASTVCRCCGSRPSSQSLRKLKRNWLWRCLHSAYLDSLTVD